MRREKWSHQEDAVSPEVEEKVNEEERKVGEAIREMIGTGGYRLVHGMMMGLVEEAMAKLQDVREDEKMLRYYQGVVAGITNLQHQIVEMGRRGGQE